MIETHPTGYQGKGNSLKSMDKEKNMSTCKTEPLFLYSPIKSETYSFFMTK